MLFVLTILFLICCGTWITLRFILWFVLCAAKRWANVDIRIGRLGCLQLQNVSIRLKADVHLEIEKLHLSSCYVNRKYKSPVVLSICDIKFSLDFNGLQNFFMSHSKMPSGHNRKSAFARLLPIVKLFGIDIDQAYVIVNDIPPKTSILHLHIDRISSTAAGVSSDRMLTSLSLESVRLQLLGNTAEVSLASQECLLSMSLNQTLELKLNPRNLRDIESINVSVSSCSLKSTEDFLKVINTLTISTPSRDRRTSAKFIETRNRGLARFPKNVQVNVDDFEIVVERISSERDLVMTVNFLQLKTCHALCNETSRLTQGQGSFTIKGATVKSRTSVVLSVSRLQMTVVADDRKVDVDILLAGGYLGYDQGILKNWIVFLKDCNDRRPDDQVEHQMSSNQQCLHDDNCRDSENMEEVLDHNNSTIPNQSREIDASYSTQSDSKGSFLFQICGSRTVKLSVDAVEVSVAAISGSCGLEAGATSWKMSGTFKPLISADFPPRLEDVQYDLDVTTVYCQLANKVVHFGELSTRHHRWNMLIYASVIIAKGNRMSWQWSHDVMVDSFQLEVSSVLLDVIDTLIGSVLDQWLQIKNMKLLKIHERDIDAEPKQSRIDERAENSRFHPRFHSRPEICHVQLTNFNVFLCCENKATSMIRADAVILQKRSQNVVMTLSEVKVTYFMQIFEVQPILRSADLHDFIMYVRSTEIQFNRAECAQQGHLEVTLQDGIFVSWSMAVHMCVHQVLSHVLSLTQKYQALMKGESSGESKRAAKTFNLSASVRGRIQLEMHLQNDHRVFFTALEALLRKSDLQTCFLCPRIDIFFDGHDVFLLEGINISSQDAKGRFRSERASAKMLESTTNRACSVTFDKFHIVFPYQYNFAECFQELKNVNKWRKIMYRRNPSQVDSAEKIAPDLLIAAKTFLVQLCDDPFEVKLRHIYETQCDVEIMSEKRQSALDQRIDDLQRTQGLIPASKIEELYFLLSQKTSVDYIQRIKSLFEDSPLRTNLLSWTMDSLEIFALADTSYHEKEKILKHMKEIDPDSPIPDEENLNFVSLFCRTISANAEKLTFQMRDFPHSMLDIRDLHVWGRLIGAEQLGAPKARRSAVIDMGNPWGSLSIERNMPQMKFYHDFSADVVSFDISYGPCWEPTMAQVNLALNKITRPSVDPSPPLPFWDKIRLLLHGRLTISVQQSRWLYHASLDPYNTTEFMDWTWSNFLLDWTNAKWILHGDLDVYSKTASKYNDCRLLRLPNLRLSIHLEWFCCGDPNDHHSAMPSAPEKLLEFDIKDYDSYKMFRSRNLGISFRFEVGPMEENKEDIPCCLFYASTLRWMDKIKMCINRVSRPIKRGPLYRTMFPRKRALTRHIQNVRMMIDFPKFLLCYWASFSKQYGARLESDQITMDVSLASDLKLLDDGLKRRPAVVWNIQKFKSHLNNAVVQLCCTNPLPEKKKERGQALGTMTLGALKNSFLLSVDKVSYEREAKPSTTEFYPESTTDSEEPVQKVKVFNLKASWTPSNRNVAFSLYDGYLRSQMLKTNLLSDTLKGFKVEANQTPKKNSRPPHSEFVGDNRAIVGSPFSPQLRNQTGPVYNLLQQLIKEAGSVAVHEELSGKLIDVESLQGIGACNTNDVVCIDWDVELYNSQVMLMGCETSGYVIASAAKASLLSRSHRPLWSDGQLKTKNTLVGSVECMQYYATVDSGSDTSTSNVRWLSKENVEDSSELQWDDDVGLAGMTGSGSCVGGVVSYTTPSSSEDSCIQLQRIIARCGCQFFCAWYGEVKDEPLQEIPIPPSEVEMDMMKRQEGADAFTLLHHDLKICTNSLQYETILDIVNNLLLYVDPKKKDLTEKLQDMRFKRHLSSVEDQRTPISLQQDSLRKLVSSVRTSERELYMKQRKFDETQEKKDHLSEQLLASLQKEILILQNTLEETKERMQCHNEDLAIMVSCYKESLLQVLSQRLSSKAEKSEITVRCIDLYFQHAEWRMTEADGQIGIADLVLSKFLYTNCRTADINREKNDAGSQQRLTDSGSHHFELGWFKVTNLLPNSIYTDVLVPQEPRDGVFTDRRVALRVLCQFASPVGGISVKRHFEVNVAPLTIQLTTRFYTTVMSFFFPGKPVDSDEEFDSDSSSSGPSHTKLKEEKKEKKRSNIRGSKLQQSSHNDIDKMKERAAKNNLFVYIKIPEVPLRVSYKSENEKLIPNIHDFHLVLPLLEYHNQTWMWHDLAMAIKSDCKKVIVRQVVKHKLHIKSRSLLQDVFLSDLEEDKSSDLAARDARKAQVLFGAGAALQSGAVLQTNESEEKPLKKKSLIGKHYK